MKTTRNTSSGIFIPARWQRGKRTVLAPSGIVLFIMILFWIVGGQNAFSQGVGISETSIAPDASSILELRWTSGPFKGFLVPRLTTTNRLAIVSPAPGLLVYDTTTKSFWYYDGGWIAVPGGNSILGVPNGGTGLSSITLNNLIYGNGTGAVNLLGPGATGSLLTTSASGAPSWLLLNNLSPLAGILQIVNGGTGTSTAPNQGGVIFGSSTTAFGSTLAGSTGQVLQSNGSGTPTWSTPTYPSASGSVGKIIRSDGTNNIYSTSTFADTYAASSLLYSNGANTITGLATTNGGILNTNSSGVPSITITPTIGVLNTTKGTISLTGNASGIVTIQPQSAAGTYNFNLPTSAGTAGQPLLSGGGLAAPMTFGTLGVPGGGTGLTSGNSGGIPYFNSNTTMLSSALLTANGVVIGGGAGTAPFTLALGAMNQLLGMNTAGTANEYKTLSGTTNQINIAFTPGSIVLSTPQNIDPGATPTFAGLTVSGLNPNAGVYTNGTSTLTSTPPTIGILGYWSRSGNVLSPTTAGDWVTTSGNIYTSGTGTITSAGLLTGSTGATVSGGAINLNASSNNATNINTGTSTGAVTIGNSLSSLYLPKFTTAGILHNDATSLVTSSQVSLTGDVINILPVPNGGTGLSSITTNNLIYGNGAGAVNLLAPGVTTGALLMNTTAGAPSWSTLTTLPSTAGVLPIANGGTNSGTALTNNKIMVSSGGQVVEGSAGTTTTVLHGNALGLPTYGQIVNADIANSTIDLTSKVTNVLPVLNGGTGQSTYTDGQLLIGNTTGNTLTKATLTGTSNQVNVTNGNGSITLSTPQDINTGSSPTFAGLTVSGLTPSAGVYTDGSSKLTSAPPSTGILGYWSRTGIILSPTNSGDEVTTSGNIYTTGTGAITSAGLLTGSSGAAITGSTTISGGAVDINASSNNATNINTGTSTGGVTIGNSANTITLPAFTTAGLVHNNVTGVLSTGLLVNSDITPGTIDLTSKVANVLPIGNGGTNSGTALTNNKIMVSSGGQVVEGSAGTTTTVLHGNALGLPTYGQIVNADIANSTIDLTSKVTNVLPVLNGGTGQSTYTDGQLLIGNTTGNTLTKATLTGTSNQVNVTNGNGSITLSTPQDINTGSSPTFAGMTVSGLTANSGVYTDGTSTLTSTPPTTGILGYWSRLGTILSPTTAGDWVTTSGNISTTGTGTITSAGLLTGQAGATITGATTISGGVVDINNSSDNATNINTGTSTGGVTIGNSANTITLPAFTTAGLVHNNITGVLSTGLLVNGDITAGTIDLTTKVTNVLPVLNGGTGQSSYLNGELLIGNTTGNTLTKGTMTGTANQVTVTNGNGSITLSTPQDIATTSSPTFAGLTVSGLTPSAGVYTDGSSKLTSAPPSTGILGYWSRTGIILSPTNSGDEVTTSGNIYTTGTGAITSAGLLTGSSGAAITGSTTISGGAVDINASSNNATNINTGTSTGGVTIGNSANTITLPAFTTAGLVHNNVTGVLSTGLLVNSDITPGTIDLTSKVANVLPIGNGGTNSGTALTNNKIMVSSGGQVVEGSAGTTTTVLHGNAGGLPSYGAVSLTTDVSGILPVLNGGTGQSSYLNGELLIGNTTGNTLTKGTMTGTANQVTVTNGNGSITLSTPQDIATTSSPTFAGLTVSGLTPSAGVYTDGSSKLTSAPPTAGTIGYWDRTGTVLSPTNAGDEITTSGSIYTTGTGTITSAGLLTGSSGATVTGATTISGGVVDINNSSDNATNINTGTSTGGVTIGNSANTITLPAFTTAGLVHNNITGQLSTGLLVNSDITDGTIDLTSKVANVLPIANGGTNSGTVLTNNKIMVSSGGQVVEGTPGTTTTILHGNALGLPTYGQIVNADIANSTIDLTSKVTNVLPVLNGGTGQSTYTDGQLLIGNTTGNTLTKATLTGTSNQVNVTNGNGSITLSTPQDINTGSSPTFAGMTLSGLTANSGVYTDGSSKLTSAPPSTGILGYWSRSGIILSPTNAGDDVTTSGNIYTTGTGAITSAGLLTGQAGATITGATTISGGVVDINSSSNNATNINTGTSTGGVTIGNSANTITLPAFTTAGLVHNNATGVLSTGLLVNGDITNSTIDLTSKVANVLPIANGGTNSGTALSGESIMISNGSAVVQGDAGTTTTLLHGNAGGAPSYGQLVNADITNSTIDLTSKVANILPIANGGTNSGTALTNNKIMVSSGGQVVEGSAGTTTTVLHGNALGLPTYGQIVNADIANSTIDLTTKVTNVLPVLNGGTGQSSYVNGELLIGNTTGNTLTKATLTGTVNQVNVTNGNGSITLSTPQDINTGSSPTFAGMTVSGLTANSGVYTDGTSTLTSTPPTTGILGYWSRLGTILSPTTAGDAVTTSGSIYTTGTGTITSAGLLTGSSGATVTGATTISGGVVDINNSSDNATNINTGTSTGGVTIGNSANTITLPAFTTAGLVHNNVTGVLSTGLLVNSDITDGTIDLTSKVANVLPIANGGTNSGTALSGESIMVSNGSAIVQGSAGTTTTVLHGNALGLPTYGQIVNADIANSTIDLTSKVTNVLPVLNGGTGQSTYTDGQLLIGNTTGNTLTKATLTGTSNQVNVTNGNGSITLSTPQDINTGSSPTFAGMTLSGLTANSGVYTDGSSKLTSAPPSTGILGYWSRSGIILSPTNAGDDVTTSGNIYTTGTGAITSAGLLTGQAGATITGATTISGGVVDINSSSNNATNINTGTSTGGVTIGNSANTITLPAFTTAGLVHNNATGVLSTGLLVNSDITNGTIDLTSKVTSVLPIANGGTNSGTALTNNKIMVSSGGQIVEGTPGTTTTVLHGNALGLPTYGAVSLTADVSGILPVLNGGTGQSIYTNGQLLIGNTTGNTLTKATLTGTTNQVNVTNGNGSITLSTPQDINITSSPTFTGLTVSGLTPSAGVYTDGSSKLTSAPPTSGILGYWSRTGIILSPTSAGDEVTTSGNIYTTGTGAITSAGLLTGSSGATVTGATTISGGVIDLNSSSNNATNINTGTSTGGVTIGNSANTITLPAFTTAGLVHNNVTGVLSTGLLVNSDITAGTIDLTTKVTNVLPVLNGGTGQSTYADGQLLIGNTTGNTLTKATLTGTADEVIVTNGGGSITLSTPQGINTTSSPTFAGLTVSGLTPSAGVYTDGSSKLTSAPPSTGILGYWSRSGIMLSPTNAGDDVTTSGNIYTTGTGAITSAGLLTGQAGATITGATTISGGVVDINSSSNNATNINTGTSTGGVTIGNSANTITLPAFTTAGLVHNNATGVLSTGLLVNGDITNSTIDLTSKVANVLPIANGGTNSGTALSGESIMISNGSAVVQGDAGTTTTLLHGNAGGAPSYGQLVNADITNSTIDLTSKVANILPIANGGTNSGTVLTNNKIMVSSGGQVVEGTPGTTTTVLHGNALGLPTYGQIVNADIANSTIDLTSKVTNVLPVLNGGTGQSTYTDGQLLIGNTTGNTLTKATLTGTSNQVNVTNGNGSITLSTPQDINTGSSPTFAGMTLSGLTANSGVYTDGSSKLTSAPPSTGILGYWSRTGIILSPTNSGDEVTTSGNIYTTGTGAITSAGLLTGSSGATITGATTISGGVVDINSSSNNATNINTGTSTGGVTIGNSANTITLPAFTTAGLVHNNATGVLSTGLLVNGDITNSTIDLTSKVANVLPIANGGTNSGTALSGESIMISNGSAVVQGDAGTTTTLLHGNAGGAPSYGQLVNADITNSTIDLTSKVANILPIANGGTNSGTALTGESIMISNGSAVVQGEAGTTTTLLHGNASGAPSYWQLVNADITNSTIDLTQKVTGTLPISNGGTGSTTQNFVDLTTNQTIGGVKTFTDAISASNLTGTNTGDVTLAGQDYLSIAGQVITANAVDLSGTNATGILAAGRFPALTGDVTTTAGSLATAISSNAVTYGKMQNVSTTSKLLGSSSTTLPVQEITLGSGLTLSGTILSASGLGGTVTDFTSGNLVPLFTTSVATSNSTPALSFSFSNAGAYTLFGNNTGLGAAPAYFTPLLASALFQNQGTTSTVLHGNASGNPSWGTIMNADVDATAGIVDTKLATISTAGKVANSATTATSSNTVNTIVLRDASDNFSAGTISADLTGDVTGNVTGNVSGTSLNVTGIVLGANGGTGVANSGKTITLGGNLTTTGAFTTELISTANTSVTLPIAGTLATLAGNEALTNKTINGNTITAGTGTLTIAAGKALNATDNATVSGINTGDQTITLTGDVSGSGTGSFATTLANSGVTANTYGSATTVPVFAVDAKGRVTSVTNTTITGTSPLGSALSSANIIVGNGSNVAAAVAMSGDVTIDNTGATTISAGAIDNSKVSATAGIVDTKLATISTAGKVANSATTATSSNTVNTIVLRDGSGNLSAGMITANLTGNVTGNASTVTTNANLSGDVSSVGNVTTLATVNTVTPGTYGSGTTVPVITVTGKGLVTTSSATAIAFPVTLAGAETLTNKTLTSPVINTPTGLVKGDVGLGNVDNTSDANKPISTLTQSALDLKEDLVNKSTDVTADGTSDIKYPSVKATKTYVDAAIITGTPDATTTSKGKIQLAGDLSGTAVSPSVVTVGGATSANIATATSLANAATDANLASTIVKRDASGNFTAGTITAALSGNATTATTASNFSGSLAGDVTGTQGATVVSAVGGSTAADVHSAELLANAATNLNTASTIVKRDASGNFAAGTITATLSGNAATATKLATARNINGVAFDGTADINIATTNIAGGTLGAIPYQTAPNTTGVLPATGTANQIFMSGANAAPIWSTATYPSTSGTAGSILRSDGTNFISTPVNQNQANPLDPNGVGTVGAMMGLAASITPNRSGKVMIIISGDITNNAANDGGQVQIRYGTGGAPSNGAALTGTTTGSLVKMTSVGATASRRYPFTTNSIVSLSVGSTYWIDLGLQAYTGGTANIYDVSISIVEL